MSEKGKKNKKKTGLGLAIWILLFLIILIVFLVKQEEIKENFDKSGATALIEKKIGKDIFEEKKDPKKSDESGEIIIDLTKNSKNNEPAAKVETEKSEEDIKTKAKENEATVKSEPVKTEITEKEKPEVFFKQEEKKQAVAESTSSGLASAQQSQKSTQSQTEKEQSRVEKTAAQTMTSTPVNTTKTKICFVAIDSDGLVVRKEVARNVAKDSPLLEALKELLKGPSATEEKTGCQSYIPAGSKLLGISIKDGIATLNFNEEFQFNNFGPMGSNVQLMQVVYTATSFSTVKKVQFLIEGKKLDYLSEGVWVGSPRGRNDY